MQKNTNYYEDIVLQPHHHNKPLSLDVRFKDDRLPKSVILFVHGFKEFKDWGHFNLIADEFCERGFVFIKINLSHNGTTPENPMDFADLEAFGNNNFSIEMDDIGFVIDYLFGDDCPFRNSMDLSRFYLVGHSRGGTLAILKAGEDERVKALVAWAPIHNLKELNSEPVIDEWKKEGVIHIHNARTNQQMPLYYQLAEDILLHYERFDMPRVVKGLAQDLLIIHGTADETLSVDKAYELDSWNTDTQLEIIEEAGHTFGGKHPFEDSELPEHSRLLIEKTDSFFKALSQ